MFGNAFQPAECLRALVYFKGGDLETLDPTDRQMLVESAARVKELPDSPIVSKELSLPRCRTKIAEPAHNLDYDPWDELRR